MATATANKTSIQPHKSNFFLPFTTFPVAVGFMIAIGVFATIRGLLPDPDIFWHLRDAQFVVAHHQLVSKDTFTYTAAGAARVNQEWLSELAYYGAYAAFGWQGVLALYCGLVIAIVLGVYWLARREGADPLIAGLAAALGKILIGVGAGPRTQHFGWLCFIAIYAILQKYRAERRGPLWALPILFCLWINFHGSWLAGAAVCALLVLAGLLPRDIANIQACPWTRSDLKRLALTGLISIAALFLNPSGYKGVWHPFETMFQMPLQMQYVWEWQSVVFSSPIGIRATSALGITLLLAFLTKKKWRLDEILLIFFTFYFGLSHERLLILAGIIVPPILARHVNFHSSYDPAKERRKLNLTVCSAAVVALIFLFPSATRLQSDINMVYPAQAIAYIRSHHLQGRMFNSYQWGGYLEWTAPELKTFIDGRADIFEFNGVLKDYAEATYLRQSKEILDRYKVDYVLVISDIPLSYLLNHTTGWKQTYKDDQAAVFERTGSPPSQAH